MNQRHKDDRAVCLSVGGLAVLFYLPTVAKVPGLIWNVALAALLYLAVRSVLKAHNR